MLSRDKDPKARAWSVHRARAPRLTHANDCRSYCSLPSCYGLFAGVALQRSIGLHGAGARFVAAIANSPPCNGHVLHYR
jgi:hypothetical protein